MRLRPVPGAKDLALNESAAPSARRSTAQAPLADAALARVAVLAAQSRVAVTCRIGVVGDEEAVLVRLEALAVVGGDQVVPDAVSEGAEAPGAAVAWAAGAVELVW